MTFFDEKFFITVACFFLGAGFGSLICIFSGKIFKKKYLSSRFSLFCIFFAIAGSLLTFQIVKFQILPIQPFLEKIIFFIIIFSVGFLVSSVYKIFIPVFLILFIALTFFTNIWLSKSYIHADKKTTLVLDENTDYSEATVINLPFEIFLPISKTWLKFNNSYTKPELNNKNILKPLFLKYEAFITGRSKQVHIDFPKYDFYPVVVTFSYSDINGNFLYNISYEL